MNESKMHTDDVINILDSIKQSILAENAISGTNPNLQNRLTEALEEAKKAVSEAATYGQINQYVPNVKEGTIISDEEKVEILMDFFDNAFRMCKYCSGTQDILDKKRKCKGCPFGPGIMQHHGYKICLLQEPFVNLRGHKDSLRRVFSDALEWQKTHPLGTVQSDFIQNFAKPPLDEEGIILFKPCDIEKYYSSKYCTLDDMCDKCDVCRKEYWTRVTETYHGVL